MTSATIVRSAFVLAALVAPLRADVLKVPQEFETIQLALNDALPGDTVLVSKGIYLENIEVMLEGVAVRGKPGAVIDGRYVSTCLSIVGNDVEVSGFTLVNGGVAQAVIDGGQEGGLYIDGDGVKISKTTVRSCEAFGIRSGGTGTIDKCVVEGVLGTGIDVETTDFTADTVTEITRCTTTRCAVGISAEEGPFLIDKNDANRCLSAGINVEIPPFLLDGGAGVVTSRVTGNDCSNNYQYGLIAAGKSGNMVVEKNTVCDNGYGLYLNGFGMQVRSNAVERNAVMGVQLQASGCTVEKNKVRGNFVVGILVLSGSLLVDGDPVGENEITHNVIQDNGGDGIFILSESNVVTDNVLKDNLGDGISVATGIFGNDIVDNVIGGNAHDGIDNSGSLTLISGNVSKGNGGADLAGAGVGGGTVDGASDPGVVGDDSDLDTLQELDLDTSSI